MFTAKVEALKDRDVKQASWDEYVKPVRNYVKALIVTNRMPDEEGIDFLVVGDDRTKKLTAWAERVEKRRGKPLNYVIMSEDDFTYRRSVKDRYLAEVMRMDIAEVYDPDKIIKGGKNV